MAANMLQKATTVVNSIWIGQILGPTALAAAFNARLVLALLLGCISALAMAANVLIARAVGARNPARAKQVVGSSILLFATISIALAVVGYWLGGPVLTAIGTPPPAQPESRAYLRVIFFALPAMFFFSYFQMTQRGAGNSHTPLYFSARSGVPPCAFLPALAGTCLIAI